MGEEVKDFIPEKKEVKLRCGLVVTVTTPTVGWWFDFLIPKSKELQWGSIDAETRKKIFTEVQKGNVSPESLSKMPVPILEVIAELIAYYVKQDVKWCKANLDLVDALSILNAFLQVCDIKRAMDFFVEINRQVPVVALLGNPKGAITA